METADSNAGKKRGKFNPSLFILTILVIAVIVLFATSFFVVDGTEQAVVTRFGKYYGTYEPGLHFKLPLGIDVNYNVPTKIIQEQQFGFKVGNKPGSKTEISIPVISESTMLTGDLNLVEVEWTVQYQIVNPKDYLFNIEDINGTIRDISRSVINILVGDRPILNVIGSERETIEDQAPTMMNENFNKLGLGINVKAVKLQNIVAPSGVQDAFEDVNKADQDMKRFINEGKEAYNKEIPKARGEAEQLVEIAKGYATERVNKAKGDVARFSAIFDEYKKNPSVTRERMYLEMMEQIFTDSKGTTIIDGNLDNMLPIKDLSSGVKK